MPERSEARWWMGQRRRAIIHLAAAALFLTATAIGASMHGIAFRTAVGLICFALNFYWGVKAWQTR